MSILLSLIANVIVNSEKIHFSLNFNLITDLERDFFIKPYTTVAENNENFLYPENHIKHVEEWTFGNLFCKCYLSGWALGKLDGLDILLKHVRIRCENKSTHVHKPSSLTGREGLCRIGVRVPPLSDGGLFGSVLILLRTVAPFGLEFCN